MKDHYSDRDLLNLHRGFYLFGDAATLKILFELDRFGAKNFTQLRDICDINPATLSKKLRILEQAGLINADRTRDNLRVYYDIAAHARPLKKFLDAFERLVRDI